MHWQSTNRPTVTEVTNFTAPVPDWVIEGINGTVSSGPDGQEKSTCVCITGGAGVATTSLHLPCSVLSCQLDQLASRRAINLATVYSLLHSSPGNAPTGLSCCFVVFSFVYQSIGWLAFFFPFDISVTVELFLSHSSWCCQSQCHFVLLTAALSSIAWSSDSVNLIQHILATITPLQNDCRFSRALLGKSAPYLAKSFASFQVEIPQFFSFPTKSDKQNGFDILYQNLKCGSTSAKELQEFLTQR